MNQLRNKTSKKPSKLTFQSYNNNNKADKTTTQEFYLNSISNISFNFAHSLSKGYYFTNKEIDFKFHENTIELFRPSLYQYSFFLIFFIFLILLYNIFDIISNKEAFDLINSITYVVTCSAIKFFLAIVICLILVFTYKFIKGHSLNNVYETIDSDDINNNVCLGTCFGNSSYNITTSSNLNTLTTESHSKRIMGFIVKLRIIYFIVIILNLIMINISFITMNHINIKNIEISKDLYSNYTEIEENRKLFENKHKHYADFRDINDNNNNKTSLLKEAYNNRNLRNLNSTITEDSLLISTFNIINDTSYLNDTQTILEYFRDNIITKQAILNQFNSKNFLFIVLNYISYYCFIYHCNTILIVIYSHNLITCLIYDIKLDKDLVSVLQMQLLLLLFFLFTYYLKQNQMKTLVFDFISSRKTKVLKDYLFCFFSENENEILSINYNSNKQSSEKLSTKNEEFLVSTNSKFDSSFKIKFNEKTSGVYKSSSDSKDSNNNDNNNTKNNLNVNLKRNICNANITENACIFQEKENENLKNTNIEGMISMNNTEKDFFNNKDDNEKNNNNNNNTNLEYNTKKISEFFSSFKQIDSNNIGNNSNSLVLKDIINMQTLFNLRLNSSKRAKNGSNSKTSNIYYQQEFDLTDTNKTNSEYCYLGEFEYNPNNNNNTTTNNNNSKDSNIQYFQVTLHKFYYNNIILNVNITFKAITSQINFHIQNLKLKQKSKNFSKSVHEFKTPLITITAQLDTLNEKILNQNDLEEIMETAVSIKHLSHYMNFLILDIIEANTSNNTNDNNNDNNNNDKLSKPTIEKENIYAVKQDIILFNYLILNSLLNYSNYNKNIESKLLYDDDLDFFFFNTNKTKFSQVLLNIISNSVKFTKLGTVMISCFLEKNKSIFLTEEDMLFKQKRLSKGFIFGDRKEVFINKFIEDTNNANNNIINTNNKAISLNNNGNEYDNKEIAYLKIIDTGKGMSPEYLEALSQGNPDIIKSNDISNSMGSGLGMNIVKNICSIMNYELSVYSENEIGTVYTIKFIVDKIDAYGNEKNNSNNCSIRKTSNLKIPTNKLSNSTSRNMENISFNQIDKAICTDVTSSKYNAYTINLNKKPNNANNSNNLRNHNHVNDNISQKVSSDSNFSIITNNQRKYDSTNLKKRRTNTNKITNYYYQNANNKNFKYIDLYLNMTNSNNLSSGSNTSYLGDNNSFYNSNSNNKVSSKFKQRGLSKSLGFKSSESDILNSGNINTNLKAREKSLFNSTSNKEDIKDNIDNSNSTMINNSNRYDILKAKESNNSNISPFSDLSNNNMFKSILRKNDKRIEKNISIREINSRANNKYFPNRNNIEKPNNSFIVRKDNRCLTAIVKRQKIIQKLYNKINDNNNHIILEYPSNINVNSDKNNNENIADVDISNNNEKFNTFNLTKKRHSINSYLPNINIKYEKPRKKTTSNSISMYFNNQASFNKRLMYINSNINNTLINSYKSIYSNNADSKKLYPKSNFIENVMCSNRSNRSNFSNPFNINFNKKESNNISLSKNDKTHSELNVNIISCKEIGDNHFMNPLHKITADNNQSSNDCSSSSIKSTSKSKYKENTNNKGCLSFKTNNDFDNIANSYFNDDNEDDDEDNDINDTITLSQNQEYMFFNFDANDALNKNKKRVYFNNNNNKTTTHNNIKHNNNNSNNNNFHQYDFSKNTYYTALTPSLSISDNNLFKKPSILKDKDLFINCLNKNKSSFNTNNINTRMKNNYNSDNNFRKLDYDRNNTISNYNKNNNSRNSNNNTNYFFSINSLDTFNINNKKVNHIQNKSESNNAEFSNQSSFKTFSTPNFCIGEVNSSTKVSLFLEQMNKNISKLTFASPSNNTIIEQIDGENNIINTVKCINENYNKEESTYPCVPEELENIFIKKPTKRITTLTNSKAKSPSFISNNYVNKRDKVSKEETMGFKNDNNNNPVNIGIPKHTAFIDSNIAAQMDSSVKEKINKMTINTFLALPIKSPTDNTDINDTAHNDIILICDDSNIILDSMEKLLLSIPEIKEKYLILRGNDGADIISCVIHDQLLNRIKVIISDENMEFINGSKAINIIKEAEKEGRVKSNCICISLTAFEDEDMNKFLFKSGFNYILKKPASKKTVLSCFKEMNLL